MEHQSNTFEVSSRRIWQVIPHDSFCNEYDGKTSTGDRPGLFRCFFWGIVFETALVLIAFAVWKLSIAL